MNTLLWIVQALLAVLFLGSGIMKSSQSEQWLVAHRQTGVAGLPPMLIKFIGISEIFGAVGLIAPWWLNIAPVLTPVAAVCFCVIMVLAAPIHYRLKEPQNVVTNLVTFLLSAFVAYGRFMDLVQ